MAFKNPEYLFLLLLLLRVGASESGCQHADFYCQQAEGKS